MSNKRENYSSSPLGGTKRKPQRTYIGAIFFIVHLALTISLSVALVISYLTPYISPKSFGSLTIMGIFAPILFIMVLVCLLVWVIARRWRIAGVVALILVPGLFHLSQFYNVAFTREAEPVNQPKQGFTVVSYNVRGFRNDEGARSVEDYVDYIAKSNPFSKEERAADIICFQELALDADGVDRLDSLMRTEYRNLYVSDVNESENVVLRTYSRYKIIDKGSISGSVDGISRGTSQWVDVVRDDDTIRVFNNHFYTMSISSSESDDIERGAILNDRDRVVSIIERVADNSTVRTNHVDSLRRVIDETPYRHIVVGDFNDTPMSYVYNLMTENLHDTFSQKGSGFGYTYRPMWGWLRIDYILYSDGFEPMGYLANREVMLSDHIPVAAQFRVVEE
ncbi:MAG: endonuclease/exonuclease/phosphatase family protein [Alistipes sp.]|nr:endonuclease/exonuclease/phosphatase family protein [Alistipes sp.]